MLLIDLRDLLSSGRLTVLARTLGMNMGDAYLAVSIAWETTQLAEIVLTNEIEFEDVCRVRIGALFPELHPRQLLDAMRKSDLARDSEDGVEIVGNAKQLKKIAHWKENASRGGKKSQERLREKKLNDSVEQVLDQNRATVEQRSSKIESSSSSSFLLPTKERSKKDPDPDCAVVEDSSLAATVATLGRLPACNETANLLQETKSEGPKRKPKSKRDPEKAQRSQLVNRLYRQRYEEKKHHEPSGMDAAFNSTIARFADKHADNAFAIVDWFFDTPNPKYKNEHYALWLLVRDADKLWGEVNNKRSALQGIAAPIADRQLAVSVNNALVIEEVLSVMPQIPAGREHAKLGS